MLGFPLDSEMTIAENPVTHELETQFDRAVSSQPLRQLLRKLFTTGIMPDLSDNYLVSAGTDGMTVVVHSGFAVIDGGLALETEDRTLEVTAAHPTLDRIDTIVLRWNENVDVRDVDLYVVQGTPSATPVRPELQRDNSIYEIGLADIFVTRSVVTITDEKITDTRYEAERCGVVRSISEYDTTYIYQQVQADLASFKSEEQADFMAWFDEMKDQLSEDAAGNLQNQIDDLKEVSYTSGDTALNPTTSVSVPLLTSGETAPSRWAKVSNMFKNIRYLLNKTDELSQHLTEVSDDVETKISGFGTVQTVTLPFTPTVSGVVNWSGSTDGNGAIGIAQVDGASQAFYVGAGWGWSGFLPCIANKEVRRTVGSITSVKFFPFS